MRMRPPRHVLMKCSECGTLEPEVLTVFSFSGHRPARFGCDCGHTRLTLSTRDDMTYSLSFYCIVCETTHSVSLSAFELWRAPMEPIKCPDTDVELGYIGEPGRIRHALQMQRSLGELLPKDLSISEFFTSPDIMYEVLNMLHNIAKSGSLYCECGNDNIQVDLYPEKLELRCPSCSSLSIIYAENEDDLAVMSRLEVIEMKKAGFTSVDASRFNHQHVRK